MLLPRVNLKCFVEFRKHNLEVLGVIEAMCCLIFVVLFSLWWVLGITTKCLPFKNSATLSFSISVMSHASVAKSLNLLYSKVLFCFIASVRTFSTAEKIALKSTMHMHTNNLFTNIM